MHFYGLVVTRKRKNDTMDDVRQRCQALMEPFDENRACGPRETECYDCNGDGKRNGEECAECGGSGYLEDTSNPDGQWDWFQFGGRCTGRLDGYDPLEDESLQKVCYLCQGTGKRTDMEVLNGCNGCQGTGKYIGWPTDWPVRDGDIQEVRKLEHEEKPYAVVTPKGEWFDTLDIDEVNKILKPYIGKAWMAIVDFHN